MSTYKAETREGIQQGAGHSASSVPAAAASGASSQSASSSSPAASSSAVLAPVVAPALSAPASGASSQSASSSVDSSVSTVMQQYRSLFASFHQQFLASNDQSHWISFFSNVLNDAINVSKEGTVAEFAASLAKANVAFLVAAQGINDSSIGIPESPYSKIIIATTANDSPVARAAQELFAFSSSGSETKCEFDPAIANKASRFEEYCHAIVALNDNNGLDLDQILGVFAYAVASINYSFARKSAPQIEADSRTPALENAVTAARSSCDVLYAIFDSIAGHSLMLSRQSELKTQSAYDVIMDAVKAKKERSDEYSHYYSAESALFFSRCAEGDIISYFNSYLDHVIDKSRKGKGTVEEYAEIVAKINTVFCVASDTLDKNFPLDRSIPISANSSVVVGAAVSLFAVSTAALHAIEQDAKEASGGSVMPNDSSAVVTLTSGNNVGKPLNGQSDQLSSASSSSSSSASASADSKFTVALIGAAKLFENSINAISSISGNDGILSTVIVGTFAGVAAEVNRAFCELLMPPLCVEGTRTIKDDAPPLLAAAVIGAANAITPLNAAYSIVTSSMVQAFRMKKLTQQGLVATSYTCLMDAAADSQEMSEKEASRHAVHAAAASASASASSSSSSAVSNQDTKHIEDLFLVVRDDPTRPLEQLFKIEVHDLKGNFSTNVSARFRGANFQQSVDLFVDDLYKKLEANKGEEQRTSAAINAVLGLQGDKAITQGELSKRGFLNKKPEYAKQVKTKLRAGIEAHYSGIGDEQKLEKFFLDVGDKENFNGDYDKSHVIQRYGDHCNALYRLCVGTVRCLRALDVDIRGEDWVAKHQKRVTNRITQISNSLYEAFAKDYPLLLAAQDGLLAPDTVLYRAIKAVLMDEKNKNIAYKRLVNGVLEQQDVQAFLQQQHAKQLELTGYNPNFNGSILDVMPSDRLMDAGVSQEIKKCFFDDTSRRQRITKFLRENSDSTVGQLINTVLPALKSEELQQQACTAINNVLGTGLTVQSLADQALLETTMTEALVVKGMRFEKLVDKLKNAADLPEQHPLKKYESHYITLKGDAMDKAESVYYYNPMKYELRNAEKQKKEPARYRDVQNSINAMVDRWGDQLCSRYGLNNDDLKRVLIHYKLNSHAEKYRASASSSGPSVRAASAM